MRASVTWADGVSFVGETETQHKIVMDGAPEAGGRNLGARPMEVLLVGAGGCTSFDVVTILKKSRQDVTGCTCELEAERADTDPKVFTKIHLHFKVSGRNLRPQYVEHAIRMSAEKYCSATFMLGKTAQITHDYEIIETA